MAKRKPETRAKAVVERAVRKNPKVAIIAIVAIVLILAITVCVIYFGFPQTWNAIVELFVGKGDPALQRGDGELLVHFIDVGQGDCIYIQFPDGKEMLIDSANYNDSGVYQANVLDYLDRRVSDGQIDYLMLTHCDSDHVYFLNEVLDRYQIDNIYMPNVLATPTSKSLQTEISKLDTSRFTDPDTVDSACYAEFFIAALTEPNCNVVLNVDRDEHTNAVVIEETTYRLKFYCPTQEYYDASKLNTPERKNAISPIGILEYNERRIMFTGDSNEINEPNFVSRAGAIDCDVLKVGHHGSETSTTSAFLDAYTFEYAVISCNAVGNTFNHPRQATLDRLSARDITVYRTDNNGTVVLSVDKDGNLTFRLEKTVSQAINLKGADTTS